MMQAQPARHRSQTIATRREGTASSLPFQIPLGALIPRRVENLLPACKNLGTTHITNGCYRLHPVEWRIGEAAGALATFCLEQRVTPRGVRNNRLHPVEWRIGEAAGALATFCLEQRVTPRGVRNTGKLLRAFQAWLVKQGVEIEWPRLTPR